MAAPKHNSPGAFARWRRVSLRAQGVAVLAFPLAVLFAGLFSIYWAEIDARSADEIVSRSVDARFEIAALRSLLVDGDGSAVRQSLSRLAVLANQTPEARESLRRIESGVEQQASVSEKRVALSRLDEEERRIQAAAAYARDFARRRVFLTVTACGIAGPLGALFFHLLVTGRLVRRIRKVEDNARRLAQGEPLDPFPAGTDEIASLARQLEDAAVLLRARERDLRDSERRYRDLFYQAPIPYEETDRQGTVRRFNQAVCALLKLRPDQVLGRSAWYFISPDQQEAFRAAMMERIAGGVETAPFECDYILDDGSRIAVEIRENLIRNANGEVTGLCRSLLDVTERNLAAIAARKVEQYAMELRNKNEQLARALQAARSATDAKSRFLASVSHELRTPLNGIIGFSELLHDGRLGPVSEDQLDVLRDILASSRHLLQLINDILDLSKVEAGKMEFRPERAYIERLACEVRDVIRPLADKKGIALTVDVPGALAAQIDTARFKQVLYNYLSNAVKFTPQGGAVTLRVTRQDDAFFKLEVEDTGIGIPANEIPRLFQEFQQLPNSRKAEQGTGLGLALTRHIVEAQGGSVAVRSVEGQGSVFSAVLPIRGTIGPAAGEAAVR